MNRTIRIFTPEEIVDTFLPGADVPFRRDPLQIYPLEDLLPHFRVPTPFHRTSFNYLVFQTSGRAVQDVDMDSVELGPGSVLFILQGNVVSVRSIDRSATGFFILFENEILETMLGALGARAMLDLRSLVELDAARSRWAGDLCRLFLEEYRRAGVDSRQVCAHCFAALLHAIAADSAVSGRGVTKGTRIALAFKRLVLEKALEEKSIGFYSSRLGVSDNYLNRCVRQVTGRTPKELIIETSLLASRVALQNTSAGIAEIAYQVGFEDPSYYGRLFRRTFGQTPREFRESIVHDLSA